MFILVLEASTTSAKAMLYDTKTNTYETQTKVYADMYEDITLHQAERVFEAMVSLGREMSLGKEIQMISLSGTWHSLVLCDKKMIPKTPVYLWSNTMAAEVCKKLREDWEFTLQYYHKTGCMVNAIYPFYKLLMLKQQGFKLSDYYIMGQGSYHTYRLTGRHISTACMESGTGLLDIHRKKYDRDLLSFLGIEEAQLPKIIDSGEAIPLTEEGARLLGVKAGTPVIPSNSDGGLNQLGAGGLEPGVMTLSVGTSGAMRMAVPKSQIPDRPSTWCYLSPKGWLSGAATSGCCNCIDWFRKNNFRKHINYSELEKDIEAEADTLVFLPFIFGERCPGWNDERAGGFIGIKPQHTYQDMYRAIQEGVLFNLYQCYRELVKVNGNPKKIKLSGGILHSQKWTQMCADIFGTDMEIDQAQHSSLLGGAVLGMEQLGIISDVREFKLKEGHIVHPDQKQEFVYQDKYQMYLRAYHENRSI